MSSERERRTAVHDLAKATARERGIVAIRGYQPPGSGKPEGRNPPTGGSNVAAAPQASGNKKD
jgi:hypothetical protein